MALVIVKLAGACNLNCSYCYVYNGADQRHLLRPRDTCLKAGRESADTCVQCPVFHVCGGGYLPHRFSRGLGFANPSVHCTDLEKLILHIAGRMAPDIPQLQGVR